MWLKLVLCALCIEDEVNQLCDNFRHYILLAIAAQFLMRSEELGLAGAVLWRPFLRALPISEAEGTLCGVRRAGFKVILQSPRSPHPNR